MPIPLVNKMRVGRPVNTFVKRVSGEFLMAAKCSTQYQDQFSWLQSIFGCDKLNYRAFNQINFHKLKYPSTFSHSSPISIQKETVNEHNLSTGSHVDISRLGTTFTSERVYVDKYVCSGDSDSFVGSRGVRLLDGQVGSYDTWMNAFLPRPPLKPAHTYPHWTLWPMNVIHHPATHTPIFMRICDLWFNIFFHFMKQILDFF